MRRLLILALSSTLFIACGESSTTNPDPQNAGSDAESEANADASEPEGEDALVEDDDASQASSEDTAPPESADTATEEADTESEPGGDDPSPEDNHGHSLATSPVFGEACPQNSRVGHFQVTHDEFYAAVTGTVASGVIPPCSGGELCEHDGSCIPYPANQNLGSVQVSGTLKEPLVMEANASDYYTDVAVPFPLFEPSAQIDVVAEGNELPGFALRAWGVPNVELPDAIWEMEEGMPLTVEWEGEPGPWKMIVSLNVDQHGNSPVTMFCEVEDTGSVTISAELVDELLGYGVSGFATADFRRTTTDSLQLADTGCVQLSVESLKLGKLTVAGHVPCKFDPDCPEGYICNVPIETCVEAN